jgi:hypothetical protein
MATGDRAGGGHRARGMGKGLQHPYKGIGPGGTKTIVATRVYRVAMYDLWGVEVSRTWRTGKWTH